MDISFEHIALTDKELKLLKSVKTESVELSNNDFARLMQHRFIELDGTSASGRFKVVATARGIDYLTYIDAAAKSKKDAHRHDWMVAIFSAFAGALLSNPLWFFLEWVWSLIS